MTQNEMNWHVLTWLTNIPNFLDSKMIGIIFDLNEHDSKYFGFQNDWNWKVWDDDDDNDD